MKKLLILLLLLAAPARAQVWFNAVPNTIVNAPAIDSAAQTKVNGNFASLVSDGNAGLATLLASISGIGPVGVPTGAVIIWNGPNCPTGYQTADGSNGTADARGVFIRGLDTGAGVDPGRTLASYQADMFLSHTHGSPNIVQSVVNASHAYAGSTSLVFSVASQSAPGTLGMNSPAGSTETRPPTYVILYCEKM